MISYHQVFTVPTTRSAFPRSWPQLKLMKKPIRSKLYRESAREKSRYPSRGREGYRWTEASKTMAAVLPGAMLVSFHHKFHQIFLNLCSNKVFDFDTNYTHMQSPGKNDNFEPFFEPVRGPWTMNVQNEDFHVMLRPGHLSMQAGKSRNSCSSIRNG